MFGQVTVELAADRDEVDALDAQVSEVCHGMQVLQQAGHAGGGEGERVVTGSGTGSGPTAAMAPSRFAAICTFIPAPALPE